MQKENNFKSKLPQVGTTIFTVMSQLAQSYGAINLSQGFPDFEVSGPLVDLVTKYMKEGKNQYAPMAGVPLLREAISEKVFNLYGRKTSMENEITITAGATEALFAAISAIIRPGDEAIVFDPSYDSYDPAIRLNGGKTVHIQMGPPTFSINFDRLKDAITSKTKLIIVNTPHNPTGAVLTKDDLERLNAVLNGTDILVISDEVYEHIVFEGQEHASLLLHEELYRRSVVVSSFGKTFHATGWKVGYFIAPPYLTHELRKVHQFLNFSVHTPVQYALAEYLQDENNYLGIAKFYETKKDLFLNLLKHSRFKPLPCRGTYFQILSFEGMSEEMDTDMAFRLTKDYGVAAVPVSVFYTDQKDEKLLRFCFAKKDETLEKAAEILCKI